MIVIPTTIAERIFGVLAVKKCLIPPLKKFECRFSLLEKRLVSMNYFRNLSLYAVWSINAWISSHRFWISLSWGKSFRPSEK